MHADAATAVAALCALAVSTAEVTPLLIQGMIRTDYALVFFVLTIPFSYLARSSMHAKDTQNKRTDIIKLLLA